MLTFRRVVAGKAHDELIEEILALDEANMRPILATDGIPFPEERRRAGLEHPTTEILVVRDGGALVGYLDFWRDLDDERAIYLSSIQVREDRRRSAVLSILLVEGARALRGKSFRGLRSHVQGHNLVAVRMFEKLGFEVARGTDERRTMSLTGNHALLDSPLLRRLEQRVRTSYRGE